MPELKRNPDGCPCSADCCNAPDVQWIGCQHDDDPDCMCDDNWSMECLNCGAICRCEV